MIKTFNLFVLACVVLLAGCAARGSAGEPLAAAGFYTEAQAMRGATLYAEQCASCHGEDMTGVANLFPALTGDTFVMNWQGKSVGELFETISTTMPALDPGSLTPEQVADLVADILSVANYPAGATELAPAVESLKEITIDPAQ